MAEPPSIKVDFLGLEIHQLHLVARATERQAEAELEQLFGLRLLESRIIAIVASAGTLPFKRLTTYAQFDKSHASRLVAGLVKKGAIVSEADPDDQRAAVLRLTAEGERLYRGIHGVATRQNELWLSAMPRAERAALKAALAKMIQLEGRVAPAQPNRGATPARGGARTRRAKAKGPSDSLPMTRAAD